MRRTLSWFILVLSLVLVQVAATDRPAMAAPSRAEITQLRSGIFMDDAKGINVMRYVFDVTGPVEAQGVVTGSSASRLVVAIKGAVPANGNTLAMDDAMVDKTSFTVYGASTRVNLDLNQKITPKDIKVFTLANDAQADKPYRVVVDVHMDAAQAARASTQSKPAATDAGDAKTPVTAAVPSTLAAAESKASEKQVPAQLLQVRSFTHLDAVTGESKLRIVVDLSAPVQPAAVISALPVPRLTVELKGTKGAPLEKIPKQYEFDGKIADRITIVPSEKDDSRLMIDIPFALTEGEYKVFTMPEDAKSAKPYRVVIDINKKTPPGKFQFTSGLANKIIAIDPGHGGSDPGAIGVTGLQEKTANLAVAKQLKAMLEKAGAKVIMTRETDVDVYSASITDRDELRARTAIANHAKADVFISIHSNAAPNPAIKGTQTFYFAKSSYDAMLARSLQQEMIKAGGLPDRSISATNFYVNKYTLMPAALVEMAFLSNKQEEKLLASPEFQEKIARGIVQGLETFFAQAAKQGGGQ
ncbi:cell wall hydrolase/autolysin [Acetonema longum DSM 6540]|uniref:Cell wall hydrolase/autolysin n=1 Tax=Acetonema longum DSM 6540 TaxID=1009370 RepID=F7NI57_9FIRM|nr:cell wall hydrolase/autolysin [Acetonema longum DSM 6540]